MLATIAHAGATATGEPGPGLETHGFGDGVDAREEEQQSGGCARGERRDIE